MASVLFSTVGQALGGPLGGAVGAIAGGGLEAAFGGRRRVLAPETGLPASSYAVPVPRIYGRTRTSGVLVWALPPSVGGGGKGGSGDRRGLVTSLAFLLSSRPVREIGRIWADGREIRNGAGEAALSMVVRLHDGANDQLPDPVIVAAEGFDNAPAFRSFAYVVLENLALGGFGNRIPALSFEVLADPLPSTPGEWIGDLCRNSRLEAAVADVPGVAQGFATSASAWREDIAELAALVGAEPGLSGGSLRIGGVGSEHAIPLGDVLATDDPDGDVGVKLGTALDERPASFTLSYLDPDRDYQRGSQRAVSGERGRMVASGAAASLDASSARAAAERLLNAGRAASRRLDLRLAWKWARVAPGDTVVLDGVNGRWRVVEREVAGLEVRLHCESIASAALPSAPGDPGRATLAPAVPPGATRLHVFEPPLSPRANAGPEILVVAAGGAAWRGARVSMSQVEGGALRFDPMFREALSMAHCWHQ
jgi:hypothetical protein